MRRREFIALMGASVAWPFAALAQEPGRIYRLGSLFTTPRSHPLHAALFERLRQYGFVEGQNLLADPSGYELRVERLADHASEIVKNRVDVILCVGDLPIRVAQQSTKTIPILASTDDMLGSGFVHSMGRPEGNTTGHSILSTELNGKRQEILMEALPGIRQMAALAYVHTHSPEHLNMLQELTRARGLSFQSIGSRSPRRLETQSTRRRVPAVERSTCWRRHFWIVNVRSSGSELLYYRCQQYTNFQTRLRKAGSSDTAPESFRSGEKLWRGNLLHSYVEQKSQTSQ
jgi:putative ABC transport system substrate-binding protein